MVFNHTKGIQLLKKCGWRTGKNIGDKSNTIRLKLLLKKQDQLLLNNTGNDNNSDMALLFGQHILQTKTKESDHDKDAENAKIASILDLKSKQI